MTRLTNLQTKPLRCPYGVPNALSVNEQEPHAPTKQSADLWYIRGWCVIENKYFRQKLSTPQTADSLW